MRRLYRHNNQISVVIEPGASLMHARMRAALAGLDEGEFTEGHELDRKWRDRLHPHGRLISISLFRGRRLGSNSYEMGSIFHSIALAMLAASSSRCRIPNPADAPPTGGGSMWHGELWDGRQRIVGALLAQHFRVTSAALARFQSVEAGPTPRRPS